MPKCPKCGNESRKLVANWTGGAMTGKPMKVQRFVCASRRTSFVAWFDLRPENTER